MHKQVFIIIGAMLFAAVVLIAAKPIASSCTTIKQGELLNPGGEVAMIGSDEWGYNYQAKEFNGPYCYSYRTEEACSPVSEPTLKMKWNDAFLSNKDCDGDGALDQHYGFETYQGSGAWLIMNIRVKAEEGGAICDSNQILKIQAVPMDAVYDRGTWYTADGEEIGRRFGEGGYGLALTQMIHNDACEDKHGVQYANDIPGGLGVFK